MKTIAVIAALFATPIAAQQQCGPTDRMIAKYGEILVGQGVGHEGVIMQVLANPDSQSFTVAVTMPNGMSCLVYSGGIFEMFHYVPNI